jgi:hypothetical protein
MRKKSKRRTTASTERRRPRPSPARTTRLIQIAASVFLAAWLVALAPAEATEKKKKEQEPHALVAGTTFTAEGLSLPGIPITLTRKGDKKPKWRATSDARGEFAVRLPPGRATYEVATDSKEHENQTQEIKVYGEETVTIVFRLARKPGGEKK